MFLRRDDLQQILMRRGRVRNKAVEEVVLLCEELDARRLSVDVHDVSQVQAITLFTDARLAQLPFDASEVDGQAADVHGRCWLVGRVLRRWLGGPVLRLRRRPGGLREAEQKQRRWADPPGAHVVETTVD